MASAKWRVADETRTPSAGADSGRHVPTAAILSIHHSAVHGVPTASVHQVLPWHATHDIPNYRGEGGQDEAELEGQARDGQVLAEDTG